MTGRGALKGVKVVICEIKCIDLTKEAVKILGVFLPFDETLQLENNFSKMWRRRNLTLEGKIIIFKTLALSKLLSWLKF